MLWPRYRLGDEAAVFNVSGTYPKFSFNFCQGLLYAPAALFHAIGKFHPESGELGCIERRNHLIEILPDLFLICLGDAVRQFL